MLGSFTESLDLPVGCLVGRVRHRGADVLVYMRSRVEFYGMVGS